MGYGFIEYKTPAAASEALKVLQHTMLDGHQLELKLSNRTTLCVFILIFTLSLWKLACRGSVIDVMLHLKLWIQRWAVLLNLGKLITKVDVYVCS